EESRPAWQKGVRWLGGQVLLSYAVTLAIWLAVTPLAASRYHLVSPVGLLIGPPVVVLTSVALITGFLLLLTAPLCWPLALLFAWAARWWLRACEDLVSAGDAWSGAHWYVSDVAGWWLWIFYLGLLAVLTLEPLRQRCRWAGLVAAGWLCVGLLHGVVRPAPGEFRCTFLAVGRGGCTVGAPPGGRPLLLAARAVRGPDGPPPDAGPLVPRRGL